MTLKEKLDVLGYKISDKTSNNIEELIKLRSSIPNSVKNFQAKPQNKSIEEITKESRKFMKFHFKLHNICYLKNMEKIVLEDGRINYNLSYIDDFDPYQLPIEKDKNGESCYECEWFVSENEAPEVYFKKIRIEENITELTSSKLTHEITHTQQDLREGILDYYDNIETLPILLEIIQYVEKCSIRANRIRPIIRRLQELVIYIDRMGSFIKENSKSGNYDENLETGIIIHSTYIESILKAINLFGIYESSNTNTRKQILNYIQNIFDANRSVEEFLEFYDTTFESSVDSLQKKLNANLLK